MPIKLESLLKTHFYESVWKISHITIQFAQMRLQVAIPPTVVTPNNHVHKTSVENIKNVTV